MPSWAGRVAAMRAQPASVRFRELTAVVERMGYRLDRQRGSHRIYHCAGLPSINLQSPAAARPSLTRSVRCSRSRTPMESRSDFPYRIVVEYSQEDGLFVARVPALPGCSAHGRTADAAAREALEAAGGILDTLAAHGEAAPPAEAGRDYSGHLRLRLPRYLHERLARRAAIEGVSLNQLMVTLLAEGAGIPRGFSSRPLPGLVADAAEPYGPERRSAKSRREKKVRESRASARGGLR